MEPDWRISQEIEKPFRKALNHASKREVADLHNLLDEMPDVQIAGAVSLCAWVSAYVAIDVVSRRWPTDEGLRFMAKKVTTGDDRDKQFGVTEQNLYLYLSQCALGFKDVADVFGEIFEDPHELLSAPFFFTVNMVLKCLPDGASFGDFLNRIEDAYEKAWLLDLNLLPALMVRARMPQPE